MANIVIFPPTVTHISVPINHINHNKDLQKLEYRHPKNFAIGIISLEMFIV